jgi:hypothetical protein
MLLFSLEYFSSHVLSESVKIETYKTIILPVGCISVKLRNMVLKKIVGPERERKWQKATENCMMKSFIIYTRHQT